MLKIIAMSRGNSIAGGFTIRNIRYRISGDFFRKKTAILAKVLKTKCPQTFFHSTNRGKSKNLFRFSTGGVRKNFSTATAPVCRKTPTAQVYQT